MTTREGEDRILPITRVVALLVIPFLLLAFTILYLTPTRTAEYFAWEIKPELTALYMGAGYLGGAYLFVRTVIGRRWHHVAAGFPAVTAFTISMLLATFLHLARFDLATDAARLWLGLYVVTPFLIPWLWWKNRPADSGAPDPGDRIVPPTVRTAIGLFGLLVTGLSLVGFLYPPLLIQLWSWSLTPLTARVVAGWGMIIGVGNLMISRDARWSAWRVGAESIGLWHLLFLAGSLRYAHEFVGGRWLNWYTVGAVAALLLLTTLYLLLELPRGRGRRGQLTAG